MADLAADEVVVQVGQDRVLLRTTLRAAMRLNRRHGGFDRILRAIMDGSAYVIADVIAESSDRYADIDAVLTAASITPMELHILRLQQPLIDHVFMLANVDANPSAEHSAAPDTGKGMTWDEYHAHLFRIATGWLGWSPEAAWNATPSEIVEAYRGRVDMIGDVFKALFGAPDDAATDGLPKVHTDQEIQSGRAKLKLMAAHGANRAPIRS